MSVTGLAIIYIIIWWIVFFAILPIDVNRTKTVKIDGEDPGSPENPFLLAGDLITVKNSILGRTSGTLKAITEPFVGIYATKEVVETITGQEF